MRGHQRLIKLGAGCARGAPPFRSLRDEQMCDRPAVITSEHHGLPRQPVLIGPQLRDEKRPAPVTGRHRIAAAQQNISPGAIRDVSLASRPAPVPVAGVGVGVGDGPVRMSRPTTSFEGRLRQPAIASTLPATVSAQPVRMAIFNPARRRKELGVTIPSDFGERRLSPRLSGYFFYPVGSEYYPGS